MMHNVGMVITLLQPSFRIIDSRWFYLNFFLTLRCFIEDCEPPLWYKSHFSILAKQLLTLQKD